MINEIILLLFFVFLLGLCWGSFLNVVAYRLTFDKTFFTTRSYCPHCRKTIFWYDNIPIISWLILGGKCRACKQPITVLYLFFELITAVSMVLMMVKFLPRFFPMYYLVSGDPLTIDLMQFADGVPNYLILHTGGLVVSAVLFLSALIAASHADLRAMVIPQLFSIWLAPVGIVLSYFSFTGISYQMSLIGAVVGYGVLWIVATIFKIMTKKEGLGVGDMELLCMIGAFLGPVGVWFALMIGSVTGMIIGGLYLLLSGHGRMKRIPFGPFLALGAMIYFFCGQQIITFLMR